ncbi:MAG: hypothetical protein H7832_06080 [Magnetococcus sp. DMHC-6]
MINHYAALALKFGLTSSYSASTASSWQVPVEQDPVEHEPLLAVLWGAAEFL